MSLPVRDISVTPAPSRIAMQRMPSSFFSNIQAGSEKRSAVRTAFIGSGLPGRGGRPRGSAPAPPLGRRVRGRPLGDRPGRERAAGLDAEVVVEGAGSVLLDDETRRHLPQFPSMGPG